MPDRPERCDRCRFWVVAEQYHGRLAHEGDPDVEEGTCHRNAPRPTLGWFESQVLTHLTTLSWNAADEKQREQDFNGWEEAHIEFCTWPTTQGGDWCGEFEAAAIPPQSPAAGNSNEDA